MPDSAESNAAVWKSDASVAQWVATAEERERGRVWARHLLAELLPFTEDDQFTFVDLGAGTGAAARAVLDRYPASSAVLADYSPQMMDEGRRTLADYEGRYRYVEIDMAAGRWPADLAGGLQAVISSLVRPPPDRRPEAGALPGGTRAAGSRRLVPQLRPRRRRRGRGQRRLAADTGPPGSGGCRQASQPHRRGADPLGKPRTPHHSPESSAGLPQVRRLRSGRRVLEGLDHVIFGGRRPPGRP